MKILKMLGRVRAAIRFWSRSGEFIHLMGLSSLVFLSDQLVKRSIDAEPQENFPRDMPKSKGKVRIMRAHNPGFSHGRLSEYPEFVKLSSLGAASFLAGVLASLSVGHPGKFMIRKRGIALLIGGAMSNVLDRARKGKVTDYLNIQLGPLKRSIVNIGDLAIYLGGGIFLLASLFSKEEDG